MKQLYENEYMKILSDQKQGIVSVEIKKCCDDIQKLDEHLSIINQYVKDTRGEHIILQVEKLHEISKESLLNEKFLPFVGSCGVKDIAVITGENIQVKTLISELGTYIAPVKEKYQIITESFETYDQAVDWINS